MVYFWIERLVYFSVEINRRIAKVALIMVRTNITGGKEHATGSFTNRNGKREKKVIKGFLKQAYIDADVTQVKKELDLTKTDTKGNLIYPNFNRDYTRKTFVEGDEIQVLTYMTNNKQSAEDLPSYIEKICNEKEEYKEYHDHFKVFLFGELCSLGSGDILKGVSKKFNSQTALVFSNKNRAAVTHELLHCMGLYHSFDEDEDTPYTFPMDSTTNLMDYTKEGVDTTHLWYWQWRILWENTKLLTTYKSSGQ